MAAATARAARIAAHCLLVVVGGYYLSAAAVMLGARALAAQGLARSEAVVLAAMLGFVCYLLVLLWGFILRGMTQLSVVFGLLPAAFYGWLHLVQGAS